MNDIMKKIHFPTILPNNDVHYAYFGRSAERQSAGRLILRFRKERLLSVRLDPVKKRLPRILRTAVAVAIERIGGGGNENAEAVCAVERVP